MPVKQNLGRKQSVGKKSIEQKIEKTFSMDINHRCCKCGKIYNEQKKYFPISSSQIYIGNESYLSICNDCINKLYNEYLNTYKDEQLSYRYVCMRFDIYYNSSVVENVLKNSKPQERITSYINKLIGGEHSNKTYSDTIEDDIIENSKIKSVDDIIKNDNEITQDDVKKWGFGFEETDYIFLNEKYNDWCSRHECKTMAQEEIFKKLSLMDLQMLKCMQNGEKYADLLKQYNDYLTSANIKPNQQNDTILNNSVPYGVLIKKLETTEPVNESKYKDVDKIIHCYKWFLGHLLKIFDKQGSARDEYEEILKEFTVTAPTYEENEENESVSYDDVFGSGDI